jgi:alanine racemase
LAAIAVGLEFGIAMDEIIESLATLPLLPGRLNAIPAINGSTLIDDTFNSSPAAVMAALDLLAELKCSGRRIAVLGDMYQLGETTVMEHRRIGSYAADIVDELIVKGELASEIGRGAEDAGMPDEQIVYAYSNEEVIRHLDTVQRAKVKEASSSNLILVKGSALTRLEQVSQALLAHPERDKEKLVRQDPVFGQVVLTLPGRPTWVEVDVEATAHNCRRVKEIIGPSVILLAVLKADAYGHGAHRLARVVLSNGAEFLGVASLNEGITLRDAGIKAPILILGYSPAWSARQALLNEMTVTLFDLAVARAFDRAAAELGRRADVHIKVDTGMGRLGLLPSQVVPFFLELEQYTNIDVTGIFTHFSVADSTDPLHTDHTDVQLDRFRKILSDLDAIGKTPPIVHCANSAAILSRPETYFDMVRLGIALHGLDPSPAVPCPSDFKRALGFMTTVAQVKQYEAGTPISYGNTYKTEGKQTIAVLPVGYADGFRRAPAHWGEVLIRGSRASIVGRVTMDQTMVDVTHIPGVQIGDRVVLIGKQGREEITVNDVADRLGTINYEVVSGILARVPRIT